jgi:hypothetical protein
VFCPRLGTAWRLSTLVVAAATVLAVGGSCDAGSSAAKPKTAVTINGTQFYINGVVTNRGAPAQGLLMNSRMVQAAFDDENPQTVAKWRYPDSGRWSAGRNTQELVRSIPSYAAKGLNAITINLQGGSPTGRPDNAPANVTTAFKPDGSVKHAWLSRVDKVIRACARNRMVVIVGLFYFGQDQRLDGQRAIFSAADNATRWLVKQRYRNVLVEIDNEANLNYNHEILKPQRVAELIRRVRNRSHGRLRVSTSLAGGAIPPDAVIRASDFVLLHGNGQSPGSIGAMVDRVRATDAYRARPKPIVFNEDSTNLANLEAAVQKKASWGYYDQGSSNYVDGFQSPPVSWAIDTAKKRAFFQAVAFLTGKR